MHTNKLSVFFCFCFVPNSNSIRKIFFHRNSHLLIFVLFLFFLPSLFVCLFVPEVLRIRVYRMSKFSVVCHPRQFDLAHN